MKDKRSMGGGLLLYIVVPCYNEEDCLETSAKKLENKLQELITENKVLPSSKVLFVDDGSTDSTWELMTAICKKSSSFSAITLAHNSGHQNALMAGLLAARDYCDCAISIDGDLQQDINAIDRFLEEFQKGNDIVYGVRNSRSTDSFFKKFTALSFYRLMEKMGCHVLQNHADYRLMSKRALDALALYKESNLFLRGIIPLIGFSSSIVYFDVFDRTAGKSKYTLMRMIDFAASGITSMSMKPLRLFFLFSVLSFCVGIALSVYDAVVFILKLSLKLMSLELISIWLLGGIILFCNGVAAEYIGRTYIETKARPKYIIKEIIGLDNTDEND